VRVKETRLMSNDTTEDQSTKPQAPTTSKSRKKTRKKLKGRAWLKVVAIVIVVVALGFLGIRYYQQQKEIKRLSNPEAAAQQEQQKIVNKLKGTIELPANETPIMASVNDATKLKSQSSIFASAQNGDKVLIYSQAKLTILYRPSTGKAIAVVPVNINGQ